MRFFPFIVLFFSSIVCSAFPVLDNYARYLAIYNGEIYEIKKMLYGYNSNHDSFMQISTLYKADQKLDERITELPRTWFYSPQKVQNVLNNCLRREGALGEETIQGERVKTCTFFNEASQTDYSIGMVPFGQVRFQLLWEQGVYLDFNLVNFH